MKTRSARQPKPQFDYVDNSVERSVIAEYNRALDCIQSKSGQYRLSRSLRGFSAFLQKQDIRKLDLENGNEMQQVFEAWAVQLEADHKWVSVRSDYRACYNFFKQLHVKGLAESFSVAPTTWGPKERLLRRDQKDPLPKNLQVIRDCIKSDDLSRNLISFFLSNRSKLPATSQVIAIRVMKEYVLHRLTKCPAHRQMFLEKPIIEWCESYLARTGISQSTLDSAVRVFSRLLSELMDAGIIRTFPLPLHGRQEYVDWESVIPDDILRTHLIQAFRNYESNSERSTYMRRRRSFASFLCYVRDCDESLDPHNAAQLQRQWSEWREWFYRNRGAAEDATTLATRDNDYRSAVTTMRWLINAGIFIDFPMPNGSKKVQKAALALASKVNTLSFHNLRPATEENNILWNPENLFLSDTEFIDLYQADLQQVVDDFRHCAIRDVEAAAKDFALGQEMIAACDVEMLKQHMGASGTSVDPEHPDLLSLFSPMHEKGLENLVNWTFHVNEGYIGTRAFIGSDHVFGHGGLDKIRRHLGMTASVAVAIAIVIICEMAVNVDSLRKIEVPNNKLESLLATTESASAFSVKWRKARAGKHISKIVRKSGDINAHFCFEFAFRLTEQMRGKSSSENLWLHWISEKEAGPSPLSDGAWKKNFRKFVRSHPELVKYTDRAPSLQKLRSSVGVLAWLDAQGDFEAAAKILGNTIGVSIRNYIPQELIEMMYRRQMRRFQNLMIIAAIDDSDLARRALKWSKPQFEKILRGMRGNPKASSREWIHDLDTPSSTSETVSTKCLFLLSPENVALLNLFCTHLRRLVSGRSADLALTEIGGLSAKSWIELQGLLANTLPTHESRAYRRLYTQGLTLAEDWNGKVTFPKIHIAGASQ